MQKVQRTGSYYAIIDTPLGAMQALAEHHPDAGGACSAVLTRLDFTDTLSLPRTADCAEAPDLPLFGALRAWLTTYFSGEDPSATHCAAPPLFARGSAFQEHVWDLLLRIPYGATTSYGALAAAVAAKRRIPVMAAQAVGGAIGRNPISIIIPCHRVIGANGALTGYGGGLERKRFLLKLEDAFTDAL
ncbi:MAG: methylated-DNA--[protein]-cysteine S-methyltransferase [Treponema sp.]|nr:methylated-DNA--[protein]-cysteine S-methyltransferase [Treponema sp.]